MLLGVAVGVLIVQIQTLLSAWRWQLTAGALGLHIGFVEAAREYYLATLVNQTLPGGVAGDAARVVRSRHAAGVATAAHSVMVERLAGQVTLAVITTVGLAAWPWLLPGRSPVSPVVVLAGIVIVSVALLALVLLARRLSERQRAARSAIAEPQRTVPRMMQRAAEVSARFVAEFGPSLRRALLEEGAWRLQLALNVAIVLSYLALFAVAAHIVSTPLPWLALVTIVPLTLLAMALPISIGGWGVREAAAAVLWPLMGLDAELGVVTSVVYGLISLFGSVPGAFFVVRRTDR